MHRAKIGLALGSGAARGWAHIGIIEALEEAGVKIDVICGSSMGALVGAAYAAGKLAELKAWALTLNFRRIMTLLDIRLTGGGLLHGRPHNPHPPRLRPARPNEGPQMPVP